MGLTYLRVSSALLFAQGFFLPLFWIVHETNHAPGSLGVYSLFGIDHPPHNDFLFTLLFPLFSSFIILKYYRHGRRWSWYVLLLVSLALVFPPTVGTAISRGIGAKYYSGPFNHPLFGAIGPFYNEVSLLGIVIPWVLFIPGIILGSRMTRRDPGVP